MSAKPDIFPKSFPRYFTPQIILLIFFSDFFVPTPVLNERRAVDTDTAYVLVLYHTVAIMRYLCEQLTFPSQSSRVAPTDTVLLIVVVEHYDSLAYF